MPEPTRSMSPHGQPTADPVSTDGTRPPAATVDGSGGPTPLTFPPSMTTGRYELLGEIGSGGMGIIYRATDTVLGREVAVKVLQEKFAAASAAARRFIDEARI